MARNDAPKSDSSSEHEAPTGPAGGDRLQKVLAAAGVGSRRDCEELITEGRVEVDGVTITALGTRVDPLRQEIRLDGEPLRKPKRVYYAVNKPAGVVTTNLDPSGRTRVIDLVPTEERVFAVGRLDRASEGLIIVTNDGTLSNRITHPRYGVEKQYQVRIAGRLNENDLERLRRGIHLSDGLAKVVSLKIRGSHGQSTDLEIVLNEGKNREIRRMLARVGHKVLTLRRIAIGALRLGNMEPGESRKMSPAEVDVLMKAAQERRKQAKRSAPSRLVRPTAPSEDAGPEKPPRPVGSVGPQRTGKPVHGKRPTSKYAAQQEAMGLPPAERRSAPPAMPAPPPYEPDESDESDEDEPLRLEDFLPSTGELNAGQTRGGVIPYDDDEGAPPPPVEHTRNRPPYKNRGAGPKSPGRKPGAYRPGGTVDPKTGRPLPAGPRGGGPRSGGRNAGPRSTSLRSSGPRTGGARSAGPRTGGGRSGGPPTGGAGGARTGGPRGTRPTGARPAGARSEGARPAGGRPAGARPAGARPAGGGGRPSGGRPSGGRSGGPPRSGGGGPVGSRPGRGNSGTRKPGGRKPGGRPGGKPGGGKGGRKGPSNRGRRS